MKGNNRKHANRYVFVCFYWKFLEHA